MMTQPSSPYGPARGPEGIQLAWREITDWGKQSPRLLRLADRLSRGRGRLRVLDRLGAIPQPLRPDLSRWASHELAAAWIGHATVLLRLGGKTILTDPVFARRVGLELGVVTGGPRRLIAPALSIPELPPLDLLLISHAHFDHLDRPSLSRLPRSTPVVTAVNTADLVRDLGFRSVRELAWGESLHLDALTVIACPVVHWGARTFNDPHRGCNGYVLETGRRRVLYGGDTAHSRQFGQLGRVDLAILGIGGYDPYVAAHCTPEQALDVADQVRADHLLPMHHSTFRLSHEPMHEPLSRLMTAAGAAADRVVIREIGRQWALSA